MKQQNMSRKHKQAFLIQKLDEEQKTKYFAMVASWALYTSRMLEREGKIKPVESCDGSFETYYDNDDAWKIIDKMYGRLSRSREAYNMAHKEFRKVKHTQPGLRFSVKVLLLFLLTSLVRTTDAKWNELSSPPGELSAYDLSSAGMIGLGIAGVAGGFIFPPLAALGVKSIACGLGARAVGSAHRLYDHRKGIHPLSKGDVITESIGVLVPGTSSIARNMYHLHSKISTFVGSDAIPQYSFQRNNPTLGENITPYLNPLVRPLVNLASEQTESATGKPIPEENRSSITQNISKFGQRTLESAVNKSAAAGLAAMQFASEHGDKMIEFAKGPQPPAPPIPAKPPIPAPI